MLPAAVDVLVLGAGLAGLRAAWGCLAAHPGLKVLVASLSRSPSGSSFANVNNALGMHACLTDQDRLAYLSEAADLAGQAWFNPDLAAIQAQEGQTRLDDLLDLGLKFKRDPQGNLLGHASCFSPDSRRAFIFTDLSQAFQVFGQRLRALGGTLVPGLAAASILRDPTRPGRPVAGVLFMPANPGQALAMAAKAVIVALGGPAGLFGHNMAGPGTPGYSYGLMRQAGVRLANTGYIQYLWGKLPAGGFWQPGDMAAKECLILAPDGRETQAREIVPGIGLLAGQRRTHCPFAHGLDDSGLDLALAGFMDHQGQVALRLPDEGLVRLVPMAHAGNGGAVINEIAETNVPGLLACGECATGMHGANRLGGAMVLATQVFGHRAGVRAACLAKETPGTSEDDFRDLARQGLEALKTDENERRLGLSELADGLSRYAVLGGRPGLEDFRQALKGQGSSGDWRLSLSREAALAVLDGLPVSG
jgi:L-aspartate oxidase